MRGHTQLCSQYEENKLTSEERDILRGIDPETSEKVRTFTDAINDTVLVRGEKSLVGFLSSIDIHEGDEGYAEISLLGQMAIAIGAAITIQIMIEQDLLDQEALLRAAGA
jgi:hypothetical protein